MNQWQDSLVRISSQDFTTVSEAERIENNFTFVKALVSSLKETNAFEFDYNKLHTISIINAPDNKFRIFSWNIPLDDGSSLYYGCIQFKSSTLQLTALLDKTFQINNVDTDMLKSNEWYGAKYYEIIQLAANKYALLGWKGHHAEYSKKVIEILTLNPNNEIVFGDNVFSNEPTLSRKVFSFSRQASMYLHYNKSQNRIEFDHIIPLYPDMDKNYKYYGPDSSYDGYILSEKKLKFTENIEIQNENHINEDKFIDPLKPQKVIKSGLNKKNK